MTSFTDCTGTSFPLRRVSRGGGEGMPWRSMDVHQQRVEFVVAAARKSKPFRSLCHEFGISRPTGYLWLRRYQRHGVQGSAERRRKPPASPRRTDPILEQRVIEERFRYPDRGAREMR